MRGKRLRSSSGLVSHDTEMADKSHLPANIDRLEPRRVHKLVHKRVLRMVTIVKTQRETSPLSSGSPTTCGRNTPDATASVLRPNSSPPPARAHPRPSVCFGNGRLRSPRALTPSARNTRVRAWRSRSDRRARWRANGTSGSSRDTPRATTWEALRDTVQDALKYAVGES